MNELLSSVRDNELERVRDLIGSKDLSSLDGYILLCEGVRNANKEIVELLLQMGATVNGQSDEETYKKNSPLNIAIRICDVELVRKLIDHGAWVNHRDYHNRTPLYIAFHLNYELSNILLDNVIGPNELVCRPYRQSAEIIKLLIDKGATLSGADCTQNNNKEERIQLRTAIEMQYLSVVEHILKRGVDVNSVLESDNNYTSLHLACTHLNNDCVSLVLRCGADVNAKARGNITPLHLATRNGNLEHITALLYHGANVDAEDDSNKTALIIAVGEGYDSIVDCILKYNPNLNNKSNIKSLYIALLKYHEFIDRGTSYEAIISSLFQYGFRITPEFVEDYSVLQKAMAAGYPTIVKDFFKLVTDFSHVFQYRDEEGNTLLHSACIYGEFDIFKYLLDKGADINIRSISGLSVLYQAVEFGRKHIVELLLNRGASADDHNSRGQTILHTAARSGNLDVVKIILKYRPDLNNASNRRSIRSAVIRGQPHEIIQSLLDYGFEVVSGNETDYEFIEGAVKYQYFNILEAILKQSSRDVMQRFRKRRGYTPLHVAAESTRLEKRIVELLLKYDVDINGKESKIEKTPLICLIENIVASVKSEFSKLHHKGMSIVETRSLEFVEILLRYGADPNLRDRQGRTALHYAASSSFAMEMTVDLLLKHGATVNPRRKSGRTPILIAAERRNRSLENVFLQRGGLSAFSFAHRDDRSFLHLVASRLDLREYFEVPLKLGADINALCVNNLTILDEACDNKNGMLVKYLLDYGHEIPLDIYSFKLDIAQILHTHVVKLKLAGFKQFMNIDFVYDDELVILKTQCCRELNIMENQQFHDTAISIRYFLTDDTNRLAAYAKNKHIVRYIGSEECKTKFPVYFNVLRALLWRGIGKRNLLIGGTKLFRLYCISLPHLPDFCIERILTHMGDQCLRSFVRRHLHMFSLETAMDVEGNVGNDLLLDGVVRFDVGKTRRIYLEEDDDDTYNYFYTSDDDSDVQRYTWEEDDW